MSRINDLLRQLETTNPALAKDLRKEYDALADRRAFGLNFERHVPEAVELPGRKVRRGDKVHILPERGTNPTKANDELWYVAAIDRAADTAALERVAADRSSSNREERAAYRDAPLEDLVVVAEFRDPIYPGLVSTGRIENGDDKPFHTVINAENYHALQTLLFTHRGQVDCIYIDPPYNTGNDGWIYNDHYVAGDDLYKHSKWLAFMERRLLLAKELLKPTGVIIVAIGDEEHHRLRMLMDQIFEPQNFISDVVWQGGRKNDSRYVSNGADYMLIYVKDETALAARGTKWREERPGSEAVIAAGQACWEQSGHDATKATVALRKWFSSLPKDHSAKKDGNYNYNRIDSQGRVFYGCSMHSPSPRPNLQYDLIHPVTGEVTGRDPNGWAYSRERMDALIADDRVWFDEDNTHLPRLKKFIVEQDSQVAMSIFEKDRRASSRHLARVFGDKRFPFPKDHEVLGRWFSLVGARDAVVVDFFGGSGTTAEAVMRLNAEDGGTRRCILVTNNEVAAADAKKLRKEGYRPGDSEWEAKGVYEYVAKPRIETVTTGARPDGSTYSDGLEQNVEFFTLTYEAPLRVSSNREFAKVAPLLWMRAGSQGRRIDTLADGWDVADTYGVIEDLDQSERFLKAVAEAGDDLRMAFVVTDEDRLFQTICRELPEHVEPVRLYEAYLRNFEIESGRGAL
ncbi:site-specific DNA-methyltransferase [Nocardioides ultimimeridianus]